LFSWLGLFEDLFKKKTRHDRLLFPVCLEEVTSNTTPVLFSVLYRHLIILTTCKEVDRYADVHLDLRRIGPTFDPNLYFVQEWPSQIVTHIYTAQKQHELVWMLSNSLAKTKLLQANVYTATNEHSNLGQLALQP
jgi:hypothetical protein